MKRQLSIPIFILLVLMAWSSLAWGQSLDGVPVGATAPSTGKFTNLEATTQFKLGSDTATTFDGLNNNKVKAGSDGLDTSPGFLEDKIIGSSSISVNVPVGGAVNQKLQIFATDKLISKGDLLTHDGTLDVPLPVGVDKQVLTVDSSATEGVRWANNSSGGSNLIINGSFRINQRGVSGTVTLAAGQYGHDRWKAGSSGATYTVSTVENVKTIDITAGSLQQVVEGINLYSGNHVLSWGGTAQGSIAGGAFSSSGVVGTITGGVNTTVEFDGGTLSKVQLKEGSLATNFQHRLLSTELVLCQRYFEPFGANFRSGNRVATTLQSVNVKYLVEKRVPPVVVLIYVYPNDGWGNYTVETFNGLGPMNDPKRQTIVYAEALVNINSIGIIAFSGTADAEL